MTKPVIATARPEILKREGLSDTVMPWEDGQRAETGRGFFEWWYFDAHFDDGSTAVVTFATKPFTERNGPLKPLISFTITRPDGTRTSGLRLFPPNQFSALQESCDVRIGPNWARGDLHQYQVHTEIQDLAADLTFHGMVPPWRPGVGKAFFGDLNHYFAWLPSIPYGTVEGRIVYDGQTHMVKGTGYHDHNWGNIGLNEVMDHWYWGRAHLGEYTVIFVEQVTSARYGYTRLPVFMLAKNDRIIIGDHQTSTMLAREFVNHPDGRSYPEEVDFHWSSGRELVHLRLRRPKLIEATSLLTLLPKWQQRLARFIANPYYFRFNADLQLELGLEDIKAAERGPALYEIMILQGKKHP